MCIRDRNNGAAIHTPCESDHRCHSGVIKRGLHTFGYVFDKRSETRWQKFEREVINERKVVAEWYGIGPI